ncbi:MAG: HIT family protein [Candidatus Taylorbacteria bacterium]|nr:HIT family protein [Candidatus Taylorbacteria bacterium]
MGTYNAKTENGKCIFCEIASGNISTSDFWENDEFLAFLSRDPNTTGFSCIIPKKHFDSDVLKMPDDILQKFILSAKEVAKLLESFYPDVGRVGLIMEGTGIDHAHIKLVPMHGTEHMKRGEWKQYLSGQNHWFDKYEGWISSAGGPDADREKLKKLANDIKTFRDQKFIK